MDVNWMSKFDWGIAIAILSLLFTTVVSFITIRYTKKSLEYTKKSVQIANDSLDATTKSVVTSIEIYERQKKDDFEKENTITRSEKKALNYLIYTEANGNFIVFQPVFDFCTFIRSNKVKYYLYNNKGSESFLKYAVNDNEEIAFLFSKQSLDVIDKYLLDTARVDSILVEKLVLLKISTLTYNNSFIIALETMMKANLDKNELMDFINKWMVFVSAYNKQYKDIIDYCKLNMKL
ncbi:hypothetical protein [Providencia rettgeri]|uniref:hypothetical protein n=1 Tax=Providencia rettgeri TaxID=587 RepID=UPI000D6F1A8E